MLNTRTRRKSFTDTPTSDSSDLAQRVTQLQTSLEQQSHLLRRLLERVDADTSSHSLTARNRRHRTNGVNGSADKSRGVTVWDAVDDESEGSTGIEQMASGAVGRKGKGKAEGML